MSRDRTSGPGHAKARRFAEFDSLRGVAAGTVAIDHWRRVYEGHGAIPHFTPLRLLLIGHGFVLVFFALSGLVLSMPQMTGRKIHYPTFVVKRLIRLYPAYLVALAIAVSCSAHWHGSAFYGEYFTHTWASTPDLRSTLEAVRLFGSYDFHRYNTAYWTLTQEMRISLFLPLLCTFLLTSEIGTIAVLVALLTAIAVALERRWALPKDIVQTVTYVSVFIVGAVCAKHLDQLNHLIARPSRRVYWAAVLAVLTVMTAWPNIVYHLGLSAIAWDVPLGLLAASLILLSLRPDGLSRWLLHPVPRFLGKISYSIYLLHGTVLWIFAYLFAGRFAPLVWLPAFLGVTLLAAWGLYTVVERPSIHLGKSFESAMKRRRAGTVQIAGAQLHPAPPSHEADAEPAVLLS